MNYIVEIYLDERTLYWAKEPQLLTEDRKDARRVSKKEAQEFIDGIRVEAKARRVWR